MWPTLQLQASPLTQPVLQRHIKDSVGQTAAFPGRSTQTLDVPSQNTMSLSKPAQKYTAVGNFTKEEQKKKCKCHHLRPLTRRQA